MANIVLASVIIIASVVWRCTGFWVPTRMKLTVITRARLVFAAGCLTAFLTAGYSAGDVIGGRTQLSKNPVRYATRLQPPEAHIHDISDVRLYWRQIVLQTAVGFLVGGVLIALSQDPARLGRVRIPQVARQS